MFEFGGQEAFRIFGLSKVAKGDSCAQLLGIFKTPSIVQICPLRRERWLWNPVICSVETLPTLCKGHSLAAHSFLEVRTLFSTRHSEKITHSSKSCTRMKTHILVRETHGSRDRFVPRQTLFFFQNPTWDHVRKGTNEARAHHTLYAYSKSTSWVRIRHKGDPDHVAKFQKLSTHFRKDFSAVKGRVCARVGCFNNNNNTRTGKVYFPFF